MFSPVHGLTEVRCIHCGATRKLRMTADNTRVRVDRPPAVLTLVPEEPG